MAIHRAPAVCILAAHYVQQPAGLLRGGAEKYLLQIVQGLLEAGARTIINFSGDDLYAGLREQFAADRLTTLRIDWTGPSLGDDRRLSPRTVAERIGWFREVRPDAVFIVQQGHGGAFGASVVAARLAGSRVVMSVRQPPLPPPAATHGKRLGIVPATGLWRRRLQWRSAVIARSCHSIIFNSTHVKDEYVRQWGWPAARCRVIANGVEPVPIRSERKMSRPLVFACVGQLARHKGCDLAVEAFRRAGFDPAAAELHFFGDGPERGALQGTGPAVHVRGFVQDRDELFDGIDLLLCPSRRESSSNSVLEAMVRGIPCIVSSVGGLPELVENGVTGMVVPSDDPASLAGAMRRCHDDPSLRLRLGEAARRRALLHHDAVRRLNETLQCIVPDWRQDTELSQIGANERSLGCV